MSNLWNRKVYIYAQETISQSHFDLIGHTTNLFIILVENWPTVSLSLPLIPRQLHHHLLGLVFVN